jgi:hypothetical protein
MEILNLGGSYESSARPSKKKFKVVLGIGVLAGVLGMGSTLAATVQINTGSTVEFGQGVAATTACDTDITVTPGTTYVNDTATAGNSENFQMRTITIANLNTDTKTADGQTQGCGGNWLIIKAYTTSSALATKYAVSGGLANSLYLGWNYPGAAVSGGSGVVGYKAYNSGISLAIANSGTSCVAKAIGYAGTSVTSVDAAGIACEMSGASAQTKTATITLGKASNSGNGANYGVAASAVQKITVETSGSEPSGYSASTVA